MSASDRSEMLMDPMTMEMRLWRMWRATATDHITEAAVEVLDQMLRAVIFARRVLEHEMEEPMVEERRCTFRLHVTDQRAFTIMALDGKGSFVSSIDPCTIKMMKLNLWSNILRATPALSQGFEDIR